MLHQPKPLLEPEKIILEQYQYKLKTDFIMKKKQILLLSIAIWFFSCAYSQQIDYNADAIKLIHEESFLFNADL